MTKSAIDWDLIDTYAERQGVSYWARRKWRQRNHVPYKWRIALAWWSDGRISLDRADRAARARGARTGLGAAYGARVSLGHLLSSNDVLKNEMPDRQFDDAF